MSSFLLLVLVFFQGDFRILPPVGARYGWHVFSFFVLLSRSLSLSFFFFSLSLYIYIYIYLSLSLSLALALSLSLSLSQSLSLSLSLSLSSSICQTVRHVLAELAKGRKSQNGSSPNVS